jgi:hypothetical protein
MSRSSQPNRVVKAPNASVEHVCAKVCWWAQALTDALFGEQYAPRFTVPPMAEGGNLLIWQHPTTPSLDQLVPIYFALGLIDEANAP